MEGILNLFLPLALQLIVLYFMARLFDRIVLRRLGKRWYLALTWPGVVIHELSHYIGCKLTLTRVHRVHLFYPHGDTLGMVEHERTRNPISNIIISIAPLFGVTAVIWLLTRWVFPGLYLEQIETVQAAVTDFTSFKQFFAFGGGYFTQLWGYVRELFVSMDFSQWQTYIFLYFMLTLSTHAAPSNVDLKHTYFGIFGLAVLFILLNFVDQWLQVPITWNIISWLAQPLFFITNFVSYGIIFTGVIIVPMALISVFAKGLKRGL